MSKCLGEPIKIQEVFLAGHSYGGATVLASKAFLNAKIKEEKKKDVDLIKGIITLDPWLFPFDDSMF